MLQTPLGEIIVFIDNEPVQYEAETEPVDRSCCPDLNGRYSITVDFVPDGKSHTVSCRIKGHFPNEKDDIESGEWLELKSFYQENTKLSIGMEGEDLGYKNGMRMSAYDYDTDYLDDGVSYEIRTFTKTEKYVFGIAWILDFTNENENQTWFGADPTLFKGWRPKLVSKTYILRWNPAISSYKMETHKSLCRDINKNESLFMNWSVYEWERIHPGDTFVMLQVGSKNDGVAMIGRFISKAYEEDSWRNDCRKIHYAEIEIFYAFNREEEEFLSADKLEKEFSEIDWHGGHSGVMISNEDAERLIGKIDDVLSRSCVKNGKSFSEFIEPSSKDFSAKK